MQDIVEELYRLGYTKSGPDMLTKGDTTFQIGSSMFTVYVDGTWAANGETVAHVHKIVLGEGNCE